MADDNVVLVGSKEATNYVLAATAHFNEGSEEVLLKARGRAINRTVDTAEIVRNRFLTDLEILDITTGPEEFEREEGGTSNVSTITIKMEKSEYKQSSKTRLARKHFDRLLNRRILQERFPSGGIDER